MSEHLPRRRLAAILAADVVGYSRLMSADEEGTLRARLPQLPVELGASQLRTRFGLVQAGASCGAAAQRNEQGSRNDMPPRLHVRQNGLKLLRPLWLFLNAQIDPLG